MKTVRGKILSSTPISVSKAAKIIANFAATDNGSSQAISAYLRRTSAAFNELKQLHRELRKLSKPDGKHKMSKSETTAEGAGESSLEPSVFNLTRETVELSQEPSHGYGDSERSKHKNKKKKEKDDVINYGNGEDKVVIEDGESKKKEKNEVNFVEDEGKMVIEHSDRKKHKRKKEKSGGKIETLQESGVKIEKDEIGNEEMEREGEGENKKKRKSRENEEEIENNNNKKKKKKKAKNEVDK